ncbi:methyltransferase domain-containing protein [Hymenobacter humi]|uniref:Methyltransferase domain-containing protein n=2 Tax=Hymenobacter humi TaxID=1411620 RepID=A0ABW2UDB9_9BACT
MFLDADDWLFPEALAINVAYLQQHPQAAFVAGAHTRVYAESPKTEKKIPIIAGNPYETLLSSGNYISMISAVLFARWVFSELLFDTSLANCEDYDLYLTITRQYPIVQHEHQLAAYRIHPAAMSAAIPRMLSGALIVLHRQKKKLRSPRELASFRQGEDFWTRYYCGELYTALVTTPATLSRNALGCLFQHAPALGLRYLLRYMKNMAKAVLKTLLPAAARRWIRKTGLLGQRPLGIGQITAGDFNRLTPFSSGFGYDRGGPIDRYYIEGFLQREAASIRGRVLEIGDNAYTLQYGAGKVSKSDVLHIDGSNEAATFIGDLSAAPHLPSEAFDCVILTQTLHLIYDFKAALRTCYRILKPGGTFLMTVPGITPIDKGEWKETWYWSFTDKALHRLLGEVFPGASLEIHSFGNVFVASAFLYGIGLPEISQEKLSYDDPQFQVINSVKAVKRAPLA